ncbi:hypothetical protein [Leisingera sp. JC1]|uniref:hypothetical protein n=1 Tax=Leisingera sp. JC1 TaxID=1855282 RepID=UPI0020C74F34|nr:hypothetical protein [Leisingera sp. JC1]
MPIARHYSLVTVAGVRLWREQGTVFRCRYDLVRVGQRNVSPVYNCVYLVDAEENILVSTATRPDGSVEERKLNLWPGLLARHHVEYGDGSMLVFNPENQTISTWFLSDDTTAKLGTVGKDCSESET